MTEGRTVAIVGGGMQGTLCAIACAAAGWTATLFERRERLWLGASGNNEGKIHLGFTYGLDTSRRTPAHLAPIGRRFEADLKELIGVVPSQVFVSREVVYARHVQSELDVASADAHLTATAALLGDDGASRLRRWTAAELAKVFSEQVTSAWSVPELTIEPVLLGRSVQERLADCAGIGISTGVEVVRLELDGAVWGADGLLGSFDRVLNCAWDGLASLDPSAAGLCLRGKVGYIARGTAAAPMAPTTFCFGPFGDVVPMGGGRFYVSWYPACLMGFTTDLAAGARWFEALAESFDFASAYSKTRHALAALLPALDLSPDYDDVRAGPILAAGRTDIYDPSSQLHERTSVGLNARGCVASINPGKLTAAPWYAKQAVKWLNQN